MFFCLCCGGILIICLPLYGIWTHGCMHKPTLHINSWNLVPACFFLGEGIQHHHQHDLVSDQYWVQFQGRSFDSLVGLFPMFDTFCIHQMWVYINIFFRMCMGNRLLKVINLIKFHGIEHFLHLYCPLCFYILIQGGPEASGGFGNNILRQYEKHL